MPQDTTLLQTSAGDNIILTPGDSIPREVRQYLEHGIEKRSTQDSSSWSPLFITVGILVFIWIVIRIRDGKNNGYVALGSMVQNESDYDIDEKGPQPVVEEPDYLVYEGNELKFTQAELATILNKRSRYFTSLPTGEKARFLQRLQRFIEHKTFYIHDKSGFKEMPVLISSAAIQVSFGMEKYLLPDFPNIHIFPEEFMRTEPSIRFLEGNVSDNAINISWKHFLQGYNIPDDGQNVGLHEMAHAYYYQNVETPENRDRDFVHTYSQFDNYGNSVFANEKLPGNDLYSDYALTDFQEFWAESVEIFFEKPQQLKANYPELYDALSKLLNQDPSGNTSNYNAI
jgi:hypothetical protein